MCTFARLSATDAGPCAGRKRMELAGDFGKDLAGHFGKDTAGCCEVES